jgi:hypothetical protein
MEGIEHSLHFVITSYFERLKATDVQSNFPDVAAVNKYLDLREMKQRDKEKVAQWGAS